MERSRAACRRFSSSSALVCEECETFPKEIPPPPGSQGKETKTSFDTFSGQWGGETPCTVDLDRTF